MKTLVFLILGITLFPVLFSLHRSPGSDNLSSLAAAPAAQPPKPSIPTPIPKKS